MFPILFHIGSLAVRSYDVMFMVATVVALGLVGWRARRVGLGGVRAVLGILAIYVIALAGARLGNVVADWGYYVANWREIPSLYGTGFQGGLIAGVLAAFVIARYVLRISFWQLGDLAAPGLVLAQAIGRVGCFLNGCCYGSPTSSFLGMYLPGYGAEWAYRYPTQLMHSAANWLILVTLLLWERRKPFEGFVFLLYAFLYSIQRLLIDFLRPAASAGPTIAGIRASELVSVATILAAGALLAWKGARARRTGRRSALHSA